jgi:hypothetical protein
LKYRLTSILGVLVFGLTLIATDATRTFAKDANAKDAKNVDAIYSVGALYYNRAAVLTQKLNKLADDYSKDGLKKYQDMRAQVFEQFEKALPFFKKAENLDPNDTNTLIALKEIFAKKDQLDISKALKERLENVQAGKKNETPYFKE